MKLIILIPTHNRLQLLKRALDSLAKCDFPTEYSKTIVIENGGKFGVEELIKDYNHIQVEYQYQELGNKSAALNSALEGISSKSLIYFTDDDVRFSTQVLKAYCKTAKKYPDKNIYGGPVGVDYEGKTPDNWLLNYLPDSAKGWNYTNKQLLSRNINFLGINWAAYSDDLKTNGLFNSNFGPGGNTVGRGQETTMQNKMLKNGWKSCYIPDAKVWHYVPKNRSDKKFTLEHIYKVGRTQGYKQAQNKYSLYFPSDIYKGIIFQLYMILTWPFFNKGFQHKEEKIFFFKYKFNFVKGMVQGFFYQKSRN